MMAFNHYNYAVTVSALAAVVADAVACVATHQMTMLVLPIPLLFFLPVIAWAALVPDADTEKSRISQAHPLFGKAFRKVFKRHRGMSHTFWTALGFGILFEGLTRIPFSFNIPISTSYLDHTITVGRLIAALLFAAAISMTCSMSGIRSSSTYLLIVGVSFLIAVLSSTSTFFPQYGWGHAVFAGMVLHDTADMHTPSGVAFFAPFSKHEFHLIRLVGRTGDDGERTHLRKFFTFTAILNTVAAFGFPIWFGYVLSWINQK